MEQFAPGPVSSAQMKAIEDDAVKLGVSKLMMMENAGSAVAKYLVDSMSENKFAFSANPLRVLAVCGTGNNGGDVFVAVRHLSYYGKLVEVNLALVGKPEDIRTSEAITNWEIIQNLKQIRKIEISDLNSVRSEFQTLVSSSQILIVGIFGTGFHGEPRALQKEVIDVINRRDKKESFCISVDLPSGMESDTGISSYAVFSDATVTMHAPKTGMVKSEDAKIHCGEAIIANIGIPAQDSVV